MREVELSKVIELYERMVEGKDGFFGTYFMETKIEEKLKRLKLMKKTLGDVKMKEDYIKVFLYSGHQASSRSGFTLKEKAIKDVYDVLLKHGGFIRVGSPYIINLRHVKNVSRTEVCLYNDISVQIPRGKYTEVKNAFWDYQYEGEES